MRGLAVFDRAAHGGFGDVVAVEGDVGDGGDGEVEGTAENSAGLVGDLSQERGQRSILSACFG